MIAMVVCIAWLLFKIVASMYKPFSVKALGMAVECFSRLNRSKFSTSSVFSVSETSISLHGEQIPSTSVLCKYVVFVWKQTVFYLLNPVPVSGLSQISEGISVHVRSGEDPAKMDSGMA